VGKLSCPKIIDIFMLLNMKWGILGMKYFSIIGAAAAFCLAIFLNTISLGYAYEDTQCFQCHTSAKKLIEATREIAKTRPALKSAETSGEG
jgi:hypothetical protein